MCAAMLEFERGVLACKTSPHPSFAPNPPFFAPAIPTTLLRLLGLWFAVLALRSAPNPQVERTGPRQYFAEVRGEMKKVAWPTRNEIWNTTIVVVVGLVVMTALIFCFDWASVHIVNYIF